MDNLTPSLQELFPEAKVTMNEFVVNVFERQRHRTYVREKTVRAWVEREGDREYDLFREMNLARGRVVTLSGAKYTVTHPDRVPLTVRCDYRGRLVLSSTAINEFVRLVAFFEDRATRQYRKYRVSQRVKEKDVRTDAGRQAIAAEYAGTDTIAVTIPTTVDSGWFSSLKDTLQDQDFLLASEKLVSFLLVEEGNPVVQFQLLDLESQSTVFLTADKDSRRIVLAPQEVTTKEASVAKIMGLIEKTTGARLLMP